MISDEELNAMLQQAVGGAGAPAAPAPVDVEAEKARLQQMGGDMTDSGGEDLPAGTKVNFAPADVSAPEPSRVPIQPKVVDLTTQPKDDLEIAYAKAKDAQSRQRMGFERGAREVVAGLTRTTPSSVTQRNTGAEAALRAQRKLNDDLAQRNEQNRLGAAKFNFDQKETARTAAEKKAQDERDFAEKEKEFQYRQENDKLNRTSRDAATAAQDRMTATGLGIRLAAEKREVDKDARGKDLPATEIAALSELPVAEQQVDAVEEAFNRLGMSGSKGKLAGKVTDILDLQGTDAAEYKAAASLAMQAAGKIVEGGKLAAGDESKYRRMMPLPGDSPAVVKQKTQGMKLFLRDLARRRGKAFKEARYNVPDSLIPPDEQPSGPVSMKFPDGSVHDVPAEEVEAAKRKGGVLNGR